MIMDGWMEGGRRRRTVCESEDVDGEKNKNDADAKLKPFPLDPVLSQMK